ncbi:protein containing DUF1805 [Candidatus Omnitrophus magneticus]|uniref:Protein containing DUF1805 n=1 Tax=Candidatus Omnitrophus magneticus TaxID=1609969 RepID=A0A0F0CVI6_9BACT|nr:protein containing DUF1805 [Candidatus Omnitrophus magneticus]
MIEKKINFKNGVVTGYEIELPKTKLILARADKGFVMCGFLNILAADKFGEAACVVKGVSTIEDLLSGKIVEVSKSAEDLGVKTEMTGMAALEKFM